ncbi:MAG TPA: helix-hairpin-helix domain-containing protein [Bacteroidota bacterium]|nr:helix-hairpin-helix domain-containing protein [Bacteroidota bacterium]
MNLLKRVQEFAAFTKNEQRVFLFLAVVFVAGVSIKAYKAYFEPVSVKQFDYSALDKEFAERSKHLQTISEAPALADSTQKVTGVAREKKVNLNTATKNELVSLPGIGEGIAEQIMIFRDEHGTFTSVDQLKKIKGIGAKKFERLRPYVVIK